MPTFYPLERRFSPPGQKQNTSFWSPFQRALADDDRRVQSAITLAKRLLARKKYSTNVSYYFYLQLNRG